MGPTRPTTSMFLQRVSSSPSMRAIRCVNAAEKCDAPTHKRQLLAPHAASPIRTMGLRSADTSTSWCDMIRCWHAVRRRSKTRVRTLLMFVVVITAESRHALHQPSRSMTYGMYVALLDVASRVWRSISIALVTDSCCIECCMSRCTHGSTPGPCSRCRVPCCAVACVACCVLLCTALAWRGTEAKCTRGYTVMAYIVVAFIVMRPGVLVAGQAVHREGAGRRRQRIRQHRA